MEQYDLQIKAKKISELENFNRTPDDYSYIIIGYNDGVHKKNYKLSLSSLTSILNVSPGQIYDEATLINKIQSLINNGELVLPTNSGPQGFKGVQGDRGSSGINGFQGSQGEKGSQGERGSSGLDGQQGAQGNRGYQGFKGEQGERGKSGLNGAQGEKGAQGERGSNGINGVQGPQGNKGSQGAKGDTGVQGIKGSQGMQGAKGDTGVQGIKGSQGAKGDTGVQGIKGDQGTQGIKGDRGKDGVNGQQGSKGDKGNQGPKGVQGDRGKDGVNGAQGFKGETGVQGDRGFQGFRGEKGVQGDKGEKGKQGERGSQGFKGAKGYQGNQGVQGAQGSQGPQGLKGDKGKDGLNGFQGPQGYIGIQGNQGVQGIRGDQGLIGKQGYKGDRGIDGQQGMKGAQGSQGAKGTFDYSELSNYATKSFVTESLNNLELTGIQQRINNLYELINRYHSSYQIIYNLTNINNVSNVISIKYGELKTVFFSEKVGYKMPNNVIVNGCSFEYDKDNKSIELSNPTDNVYVEITGELKDYTISYIFKNITYTISNPKSQYHIGDSIELSLVANEGYDMPNSISSTNCNIDYNVSLDKRTASLNIICNGKGNITISGTATSNITYYFGIISINDLNKDKIEIDFRTRPQDESEIIGFNSINIKNTSWLNGVKECPFNINVPFELQNTVVYGDETIMIVPQKFIDISTSTFTDETKTGKFHSASTSIAFDFDIYEIIQIDNINYYCIDMQNGLSGNDGSTYIIN